MTARYSIVKPIAAGGMGAVYLARREGIEGFSRLVAIKRAHTDLAGAAAYKKRLLREASLASRIHHANVVSVVDIFDKANEIWLVLDWIDGTSLSKLWKQEPIPAPIAARIVLDAANGIMCAHELVDEAGEPAGLQHGDVSPQNVLVGKDGVARIADFGLAKPFDATLTATGDRFVEGKLGYLAPELFAGKQFTEACDLYALAIVAWETLAGKRLFTSRAPSELTREQRAAPSLSSVAPALEALDGVLARGLSFLPDKRHKSVRAFTIELEEAARKAGILASSLEVATYVQGAIVRGEEAQRSAIEKKGVIVAPRRRPPVAEQTPATASVAVAEEPDRSELTPATGLLSVSHGAELVEEEATPSALALSAVSARSLPFVDEPTNQRAPSEPVLPAFRDIRIKSDPPPAVVAPAHTEGGQMERGQTGGRDPWKEITLTSRRPSKNRWMGASAIIAVAATSAIAATALVVRAVASDNSVPAVTVTATVGPNTIVTMSAPPVFQSEAAQSAAASTAPPKASSAPVASASTIDLDVAPRPSASVAASARKPATGGAARVEGARKPASAAPPAPPNPYRGGRSEATGGRSPPQTDRK